MKVTLLPLDKITPYARNPRKNATAVATVKASLKEYGWQQPIVIDSEGVIVAGHTRYLAALELGWTEAPVYVASDLTPAQVKAYRLMDNKSHERAEWDMELLALEMDDLKALDFDLDLTGFTDEELAGFAPDEEGGAGVGHDRPSMAERFGIPPFSVLNAREGWWQARKQAWIALGIKSELGRGRHYMADCFIIIQARRDAASFKNQGAQRALQNSKKQPNATPGGR